MKMKSDGSVKLESDSPVIKDEIREGRLPTVVYETVAPLMPLEPVPHSDHRHQELVLLLQNLALQNQALLSRLDNVEALVPAVNQVNTRVSELEQQQRSQLDAVIFQLQRTCS